MLGLFLSIALCSNLQKTLNPKEIATFYEKVSDNDQYCDLFLSRISQSEEMYYRIVPPNSGEFLRERSESSTSERTEVEAIELPLERNVHEKLEKPGIWTIQIYNRGNDIEKFSISSHSVKKIAKGNEDVVALRNLLNQLQNAVETLGNENFYARNIQLANIKEAKSIRKTLRWLVLFPILTFGIAYAKYVLARQLVRPKGKRFKGLF